MKRRHVELIIKVCFVFGLLYFLGRKGLISFSVEDTQRAFTRWDKILPAAAILVASSVLGVFRWQMLLEAQGIHLTWLRVFQLSFIGNFFNIALPGAVSGDFVKAFYIGKELEGKRARAFGSILFDRVAGLSALVLVSAFALILGFKSFWGTPMFLAIKVVISIAAACVCFFYIYLFTVQEKHDPLLVFFKKMELKISQLSSFTRIYEGLRHYHTHRVTVFKVLILSMVVHFSVGLAFYYFTQAFGDDSVGILSLCVVFPLGLLVTAIPVMPAGIGTGHAAFFYFFALIGSKRGADVFTLFAFFNILLGIVGGLIYLRFKSREPGEVVI